MKSNNAYFIILAITTILFSILLIDYLIPVFWAIIFSILFSPFYNWLNEKTGRSSLSSSITIFVILLLVILPSILILGAITNEVFKIVSMLESGSFEIGSSSNSVYIGLSLLNENTSPYPISSYFAVFYF